MAAAGRIVVVDFGMGNLSSVEKQLGKLCASIEVTSNPLAIARADRLVLPGVGHFALAMQNIDSLGLRDAIERAVVHDRKPVLGICLGMQLMARSSEEGGAAGFGWLDADVVRLRVGEGSPLKIPHMGWNQVRRVKPSILLRGIEDEEEFYFTHSYHLRFREMSAEVGETTYGLGFPSTIEQDNIFGVQYHPEKSHRAGIALLQNFLSS